MASLHERVIELLPGLRRYACALTGNRGIGDEYIRVALLVQMEDPRHLKADVDLKFHLYKLFHKVLDALIVPADESVAEVAGAASFPGVEEGLIALPLLSRKILLLTSVEGFAVERAAALLGLPVREARLRLVRARMQMSCVGAPSLAPRLSRFLGRRAA